MRAHEDPAPHEREHDQPRPHGEREDRAHAASERAPAREDRAFVPTLARLDQRFADHEVSFANRKAVLALRYARTDRYRAMDARCRTARPRRGRGHPRCPGRTPGWLPPDRRRQRLDRRHRGRRACRTAPRLSPNRNAASAPRVSRGCARPPRMSCASWTVTARSRGRSPARRRADRRRPRRPRTRRAAWPTRGAWPVHARLANRVLVAELRRRACLRLRDLGPMRAARREHLLALGIVDRRFGWPLEMVLLATRDNWRIAEVNVRYEPRVGRSKVTGTIGGTTRAGTRHGPAAAMTPTTLIVIAKSPVPGRVKTRLTPPCTPAEAAAIAAASLADTLETVAATPATAHVLALDGAPRPVDSRWLCDRAATRRRARRTPRQRVRVGHRTGAARRDGHSATHAEIVDRCHAHASQPGGRRGARPGRRRGLVDHRLARPGPAGVRRRTDEHRGDRTRATGATRVARAAYRAAGGIARRRHVCRCARGRGRSPRLTLCGRGRARRQPLPRPSRDDRGCDQPRPRRACRSSARPRARDHLHDLLPDRPVLAPRAASGLGFRAPGPPRRALSLHPRPARRDRHRFDPIALRQAVVRLPEAVPMATRQERRACSRAAVHLSAGRGQPLPALHRAGQHPPLVSVALRLPAHALPRRVDHDRRAARAHRRPVHGEPARARRAPEPSSRPQTPRPRSIAAASCSPRSVRARW